MIRTLLTLAAGIGVGVTVMFAADSDHHKAVKVTQLSQRDIIEKLDGKAASATVVEVTFEPGQKDPPHHHAGPVFGYVLEGEYEHAINDEPIKSYKAGDTFYEPTGSCAPRGPEPECQGQNAPPGSDPAPPRFQGRDNTGRTQAIGLAEDSRLTAAARMTSRKDTHGFHVPFCARRREGRSRVLYYFVCVPRLLHQTGRC